MKTNKTIIKAGAARIDSNDADSVRAMWEMGAAFHAGVEADEWTSLRTAEDATGVSKSELGRCTKVHAAFSSPSAAAKAFLASEWQTCRQKFANSLGESKPKAAPVARSQREIAAAKRITKSADFLALPESVQKRVTKALGL